MRVGLFALGAAIALMVGARYGHPAKAACGVLVNSACCQASSPADTSCICKPHAPICKCSTAGGAIQGGTIIICETDDWSYVDPKTYKIALGETTLCKTVKSCTTSQQSQTCGDSGSCSNGPQCTWVPQVTHDTPFVYNGDCDEEPGGGA